MQFITILAGHNFRPAECKVALAEIKRGMAHTLYLERDRENAYDANAIKVLADIGTEDNGPQEYFIGFIAGPDAALIAPYLDATDPDDEDEPRWADDYEPQVERVAILDWVSGDKKPTLVIEISTGFEVGTLVSGPDEDGDGDEDFLPSDDE